MNIQAIQTKGKAKNKDRRVIDALARFKDVNDVKRAFLDMRAFAGTPAGQLTVALLLELRDEAGEILDTTMAAGEEACSLISNAQGRRFVCRELLRIEPESGLVTFGAGEALVDRLAEIQDERAEGEDKQ